MTTFRRTRRIVFGSLVVLATFARASFSAALAQIDPDDSGEGVRRGLAERGNSGQVGTVTLLQRGPNRTLIVLRVFSVPPGRAEPAGIGRGTCARRGSATLVARLADVENGRSRTVVPMSLGLLASGRYYVAVSKHAGSARISCGEL